MVGLLLSRAQTTDATDSVSCTAVAYFQGGMSRDSTPYKKIENKSALVI